MLPIVLLKECDMLMRKKKLSEKTQRKTDYLERAYTPDELQREKDILLSDKTNGIESVVDLLISQAVVRQASDIHFEPHINEVSVKYRIDGMMYPIADLPVSLKEGLLMRIKVLSHLIVYRRDIPQDGSIHISGQPIELRVTTFPTIYGEKAVIRILDSRNIRFKLEQLGFSQDISNTLENLILKPQGVLLLTGPANSGKTTTLYACIQKILEKRPLCNIITLEDPVEYTFGNISQTHVNSNASFTYADALRSILRQDPEVILVGEIRDEETARMVMEAGLTGHLVLTTIHSGSAVSVFVRLLEMNIEPFLLSSAISGVINQRLVRKVCQSCAVEYLPSHDILSRLKLSDNSWVFKKGKGCNNCLYQGYSGRTVISEMVLMDDRLRQFILKKPSISQLKNLLQELNNRTLVDDGLEKVKQGITTPEEIDRVILVSQT